jgi:hypothetical protein
MMETTFIFPIYSIKGELIHYVNNQFCCKQIARQRQKTTNRLIIVERTLTFPWLSKIKAGKLVYGCRSEPNEVLLNANAHAASPLHAKFPLPTPAIGDE